MTVAASPARTCTPVDYFCSRSEAQWASVSKKQRGTANAVIKKLAKKHTNVISLILYSCRVDGRELGRRYILFFSIYMGRGLLLLVGFDRCPRWVGVRANFQVGQFYGWEGGLVTKD